MRSVALFCASAGDLPDRFRAAASAFGEGCARRGLRIVYGGSDVGLMGIAAHAAMAAGGQVTGVLPEGLVRGETADRTITELLLVATLAERKAKMAALADAFVALPGGLGTLDEFTHILLGNDLGHHRKPLFLCNVDGFWDPLVRLIRHFDAAGVLRPGAANAYAVVPDVPALFRALAAHAAAPAA